MSNSYCEQAILTVRQTPAGKVGFSVTHYDALGRVTVQLWAFGGTLDLGDPGNVSDATVTEQSESAYDHAGNAISVTSRQRFDDATGTGELHDPATEPKARVSFAASYPDAIGRTQAQADYGTNGGTAWTRPATVPTRSDTVLVTSFMFDDAGDQTESTDPMGTVTRQEFDQAGRVVKTIDNCHA